VAHLFWRCWVASCRGSCRPVMAALIDHPEWAPERPAVGFAPKLSDAELVTLAVIQALLGYTSEAQFIRYAHAHLRPWFVHPASDLASVSSPVVAASSGRPASLPGRIGGGAALAVSVRER